MLTKELTGRQKQVVDGLLAGLSNAEIARDIGCKERTVKSHLVRIAMLNGLSSANRIVIARSHMEPGRALPEMKPQLACIARLIMDGLGSPEIARLTGTSEQVIKNQTKEIYDITGVWSRLELTVRYGGNTRQTPRLEGEIARNKTPDFAEKSASPEPINSLGQNPDRGFVECP